MLFHVGLSVLLVRIVMLFLGPACLLAVRLVLARVALSVFADPTDHCIFDDWFPFAPQLRLHELLLLCAAGSANVRLLRTILRVRVWLDSRPV